MTVEARYYPLKERNETKLLGFAHATIIDGDMQFAINSIAVIEGKNGNFLSFPSVKRKDGSRKDLCFPCSKAMRTAIEDAVFAVM